MPLNINLPVNHVDGDTGHTAGHNATNTAVNSTAAAVDALAAVATSGSASDLTTGTLPDNVIPSGIARDTEVTTAVANLVAAAPSTMDTLNELAAALGNDPSFATTVSTALGNRLRVDASQSLTSSQQAQGRVNLSATPRLTVTAVKTSNYTAAANEFVPVDTTSAGVTITLPTAPADGDRVGIKHVVRGGTNTVTVALGGSEVLNVAGGPTSGTVMLLNQVAILQYLASGSIWYVVGDDIPLSQLDVRYQPLDTDLTTIAGLTATTDNFLQAKASAWASRTPAQVAADLVTPLSSSFQPLDSDLTTIAGLTATTDSFLQVKAGAWAARTIAQVSTDLGLAVITGNNQTGTSYTLVLGDAGKCVECNNASAITLTIPPNSSVAFPVGTVVEVFQQGAGQITVTAGSGVTLRAPDGAKTAKQYASASLRQRAADEWVLAGNVST